MTVMTLQAPASAGALGVIRTPRMNRQVGSNRHQGGVRACVGVVPASSRSVTPGDGGLYWTRRGLAVAMFVIAAFVVTVLATIVVQFLAVSGTPPMADGEGGSARSAAIHARS